MQNILKIFATLLAIFVSTSFCQLVTWQTYVDDVMIRNGLTGGAIVRLDDGDVWAATPGFSPTPHEIQTVLAGYKDLPALYENGVTIGNVKCMAVKATDRSIYGKRDKDGVIIVKTKRLLLIGLYDKHKTPVEAGKVVEGLGDYMLSVGY